MYISIDTLWDILIVQVILYIHYTKFIIYHVRLRLPKSLKNDAILLYYILLNLTMSDLSLKTTES